MLIKKKDKLWPDFKLENNPNVHLREFNDSIHQVLLLGDVQSVTVSGAQDFSSHSGGTYSRIHIRTQNWKSILVVMSIRYCHVANYHKIQCLKEWSCALPHPCRNDQDGWVDLLVRCSLLCVFTSASWLSWFVLAPLGPWLERQTVLTHLCSTWFLTFPCNSSLSFSWLKKKPKVSMPLGTSHGPGFCFTGYWQKQAKRIVKSSVETASTAWREELQNHLRECGQKKGWRIGAAQWFYMGIRRNLREPEFYFKAILLRQCSLPSGRVTGGKAHGNTFYPPGSNVFGIPKRRFKSGVGTGNSQSAWRLLGKWAVLSPVFPGWG